MKFALMINQGPYTHQASDTAYHFACAVLKAGHEVFRIFFYHDGVNNATRMPTPPQDERHVIDRWSELASQHKLDLVVCVAAAQRRGILDEDEARRGLRLSIGKKTSLDEVNRGLKLLEEVRSELARHACDVVP